MSISSEEVSAPYFVIRQRRRRSKPHTFEENIAAEKLKLVAEQPGPASDKLLAKIGQLDTIAYINEWLPRQSCNRHRC